VSDEQINRIVLAVATVVTVICILLVTCAKYREHKNDAERDRTLARLSERQKVLDTLLKR
jgi:heme/copper-type cytochrome/quinol oxidase subunit 2